MKLNVKEIAVFGMLGCIMCVSKLVMEILPNIHLLGVFVIAFTVVYRQKALYPIYVYVFLDGLICGFATWWVPYLYIWTLLWGAAMLLPKNMSPKVSRIVYSCLCSAHGFLFGVLYAPAQAFFYGLDFKGMVAWIITGIPADLIHGISNLFCGMLIMPIISVLKKTVKQVKYD